MVYYHRKIPKTIKTQKSTLTDCFFFVASIEVRKVARSNTSHPCTTPNRAALYRARCQQVETAVDGRALGGDFRKFIDGIGVRTDGGLPHAAPTSAPPPKNRFLGGTTTSPGPRTRASGAHSLGVFFSLLWRQPSFFHHLCRLFPSTKTTISKRP